MIIPRHLLNGRNIFWKFDEDICINGWEIKIFVKCEKNAYGGHFVFQKKLKNVPWHLEIGRNIFASLVKVALTVCSRVGSTGKKLNDHGRHFVFPNEANILQRHLYLTINIVLQFCKDIFINGRHILVHANLWQTKIRKTENGPCSWVIYRGSVNVESETLFFSGFVFFER